MKIANELTRDSTYKHISVVECVENKEDLPATSFIGNCVFCGNKPVWWTGIKWVDATLADV